MAGKGDASIQLPPDIGGRVYDENELLTAGAVKV